MILLATAALSAVTLTTPFVPSRWPGDAGDVDDVGAIEKACLDYVDGFYEGSRERIERGVHPSLQKVTVRALPWGRELQTIDRESLVEYASLENTRKTPQERQLDVVVLAVHGNAAIARIDSADFVDHAQLVEINGTWRVINVLWAPQDAQVREADPGAADLAAIEAAGLDYVDGFYAASPERLARALHPRLQKVMVQRLPNGREILQYTSTDGLLGYARSGRSRKPAAERHVEVEIHDVFGDIATIEIRSADFLDYAHVARLDGEWKIVNVAWVPRR